MRTLVVLALFFAALIPPAAAQTASDSTAFPAMMGVLRDSFIQPLRERGIPVGNAQRALFIGFILSRQRQYLDDFVTDRQRLQALENEVRAFIATLPDADRLWASVTAGLSGGNENAVRQLLGSVPHVPQVVHGLNDIMMDQKVTWSSTAFLNYPAHQDVIDQALLFLRLTHEKRFAEIPPLLGGRMVKGYARTLERWRSDANYRQELERHADQLVWSPGACEMTATNPPVARLIFALPNEPQGSRDYEILLVLDAGNWKITRFGPARQGGK